MSRTGLVLVFGVCVWFGPAGQGAEPVGMPRPVVSSTVEMPASPEPTPEWSEGCRKERFLKRRPVRSCLGHLREWLCYRSPESPCRACCKQPLACCQPPLYAFFLHRCDNCGPSDEGAIVVTYSYANLLPPCGERPTPRCRTCR